MRTFTASLGGEYARFRTESVLAGQGGSAELLAAYLGDGSQVHDFRTLQEHGAPRTKSDLVFKGAVAGTARSVYSGLIRMRHGAKGADAFQTNRNLVLSEGAHADSVPNLDIEENDVRCSHASAVGPIDREQRFYLEARGVPPAVAERLILLGFFDDLWARITAPGSSRPSRRRGRGPSRRCHKWELIDEGPTVRDQRPRGGTGAPFRDRRQARSRSSIASRGSGPSSTSAATRTTRSQKARSSPTCARSSAFVTAAPSPCSTARPRACPPPSRSRSCRSRSRATRSSR